MYIIPAIDIIDGKCVRLSKGDYNQMKVYNEDPLEVARTFEDHGIERLHLVDLDGAKAKHIVNYAVLEKIAGKTSLKIDFGGGVQSDEDLRIAFESGAQQVTGGSIAVKSPETFESWLQKHGPEKLILGADVKDGKIAVSGWQEKSKVDLNDFLEKWQKAGARYVISTEVSKDGMLKGPATEMYKDMADAFPDFEIIASGGVSAMKDIDALNELSLYGVIVGKAIYEGKVTLKEIEKYNQ